jgi:hypothetical protein
MREMEDAGMKADVVTFTSLINACGRVLCAPRASTTWDFVTDFT